MACRRLSETGLAQGGKGGPKSRRPVGVTGHMYEGGNADVSSLHHWYRYVKDANTCVWLERTAVSGLCPACQGACSTEQKRSNTALGHPFRCSCLSELSKCTLAPPMSQKSGPLATVRPVSHTIQSIGLTAYYPPAAVRRVASERVLR